MNDDKKDWERKVKEATLKVEKKFKKIERDNIKHVPGEQPFVFRAVISYSNLTDNLYLLELKFNDEPFGVQ